MWDCPGMVMLGVFTRVRPARRAAILFEDVGDRLMFTPNLQLLTFKLGLQNSRTIWITFGDIKALSMRPSSKTPTPQAFCFPRTAKCTWVGGTFGDLPLPAMSGSSESEIQEQNNCVHVSSTWCLGEQQQKDSHLLPSTQWPECILYSCTKNLNQKFKTRYTLLTPSVGM